jgi:hypothetical protein
MWQQPVWYPYQQRPMYPPQMMYTEYDWQAQGPMAPQMPRPPQMPQGPLPQGPLYRHAYEATLEPETLVATGFTTLVESMLGAMQRGLNAFPSSMRVTPFAAFTSSDERVRNDVASVRGSGPSVVDFDAVVPDSAESALTESIRFADFLLTQAAPNLHHSQHAAFNAALRMVRSVMRYTRVVYKHRHGLEPIGSDPEMGPSPPGAYDALVAARVVSAYLVQHRKSFTTKELELIGKCDYAKVVAVLEARAT